MLCRPRLRRQRWQGQRRPTRRVHQYSVQLAHAFAQRCQVYHFVAQATHFQLHADLECSVVGCGSGWRGGLGTVEEYFEEVQVYSIRLGVVELLVKDES